MGIPSLSMYPFVVAVKLLSLAVLFSNQVFSFRGGHSIYLRITRRDRNHIFAYSSQNALSVSGTSLGTSQTSAVFEDCLERFFSYAVNGETGARQDTGTLSQLHLQLITDLVQSDIQTRNISENYIPKLPCPTFYTVVVNRLEAVNKQLLKIDHPAFGTVKLIQKKEGFSKLLNSVALSTLRSERDIVELKRKIERTLSLVMATLIAFHSCRKDSKRIEDLQYFSKLLVEKLPTHEKHLALLILYRGILSTGYSFSLVKHGHDAQGVVIQGYQQGHTMKRAFKEGMRLQGIDNPRGPLRMTYPFVTAALRSYASSNIYSERMGAESYIGANTATAVPQYTDGSIIELRFCKLLAACERYDKQLEAAELGIMSGRAEEVVLSLRRLVCDLIAGHFINDVEGASSNREALVDCLRYNTVVMELIGTDRAFCAGLKKDRAKYTHTMIEIGRLVSLMVDFAVTSDEFHWDSAPLGGVHSAAFLTGNNGGTQLVENRKGIVGRCVNLMNSVLNIGPKIASTVSHKPSDEDVNSTPTGASRIGLTEAEDAVRRNIGESDQSDLTVVLKKVISVVSLIKYYPARNPTRKRIEQALQLDSLHKYGVYAIVNRVDRVNRVSGTMHSADASASLVGTSRGIIGGDSSDNDDDEDLWASRNPEQGPFGPSALETSGISVLSRRGDAVLRRQQEEKNKERQELTSLQLWSSKGEKRPIQTYFGDRPTPWRRRGSRHVEVDPLADDHVTGRSSCSSSRSQSPQGETENPLKADKLIHTLPELIHDCLLLSLSELLNEDVAVLRSPEVSAKVAAVFATWRRPHLLLDYLRMHATSAPSVQRLFARFVRALFGIPRIISVPCTGLVDRGSIRDIDSRPSKGSNVRFKRRGLRSTASTTVAGFGEYAALNGIQGPNDIFYPSETVSEASVEAQPVTALCAGGAVETFEDIRYRDPANLLHLQRLDSVLVQVWTEGRTADKEALPGFADAETLLMLGEDSHTCMSIRARQKATNRGLLSILLNGSCRVVGVKDKAGRLVSRAIVRLLVDSATEMPVLYVEPPCGLNDDDNHTDVYKQAAELGRLLRVPTIFAKPPPADLYSMGPYESNALPERVGPAGGGGDGSEGGVGEGVGMSDRAAGAPQAVPGGRRSASGLLQKRTDVDADVDAQAHCREDADDDSDWDLFGTGTAPAAPFIHSTAPLTRSTSPKVPPRAVQTLDGGLGSDSTPNAADAAAVAASTTLGPDTDSGSLESSHIPPSPSKTGAADAAAVAASTTLGPDTDSGSLESSHIPPSPSKTGAALANFPAVSAGTDNAGDAGRFGGTTTTRYLNYAELVDLMDYSRIAEFVWINGVFDYGAHRHLPGRHPTLIRLTFPGTLPQQGLQLGQQTSRPVAMGVRPRGVIESMMQQSVASSGSGSSGHNLSPLREPFSWDPKELSDLESMPTAGGLSAADSANDGSIFGLATAVRSRQQQSRSGASSPERRDRDGLLSGLSRSTGASADVSSATAVGFGSSSGSSGSGPGGGSRARHVSVQKRQYDRQQLLRVAAAQRLTRQFIGNKNDNSNRSETNNNSSSAHINDES